MKTEIRSLSGLKPYAKNARINDATVVELRRLMDKFGYLVPMVVTEEGVIVTGHARFKALKKEGVKKATVVVVSEDEKADEFRLLDNKIHDLSGWDEEKLNIELRGLDGTREEMFPGLGREEISAITISKVTDEDLVAKNNELMTHFENQAKKMQDSLVRIKCPSCEREFQVKEAELERDV